MEASPWQLMHFCLIGCILLCNIGGNAMSNERRNTHTTTRVSKIDDHDDETSMNVKNFGNDKKKRALEDVDDAVFDYDLSGYSIRFGKCQHVKMFDDELAEDEESETVLAMKHFVLYRMCPSDECSICDENYGEYVVEVDQYLENIAEFTKRNFEIECEICAENNYMCDDDTSSSCACNDCNNYYNMEENGYVDATEFIQCQKLDVQNGGDDDDEDDENNGDDNNQDIQLYIGPRCTNEGSQIVIDVFTDENCWERYEDEDLQTLLGLKISYLFLKPSYSRDARECLSCLESDYASYEENDRDQADEDDVLEMCENIYEQSAKCETKHGFVNGLMKKNGYENQIQNEFDVCTFIDSLAWGSYDEKGEINVGQTQDVFIRYVTSLQATMLSILTLTIVGLGSYAVKLFNYIEMSYPAHDLTSKGGTFV